MTQNVTIVTALFDLGRSQLTPSFQRSFEHYKNCFAQLLKVNYPMVIYCDVDVEELVWQHRDRSNTSVIRKTLDDLRAFPFFDKVNKIRTNPTWYDGASWLSDSPQAKLDLYNPLVMSKQFFLNDASLFNTFNTEHFLWVDGGISNTIGDPVNYFDGLFYSRIKPDLKKMLYLAFPYGGTTEVHGFEKNALNEYATKDTKYVCRGGIFGGSKDSINDLNDIYYHLLQETLSDGLMGTEESIFTIIAHKHPEKVNVQMIKDDGLVRTYLDRLKKKKVTKKTTTDLALYSLTYDTPKQYELWVASFLAAYPETFTKTKKYVVDNTVDEEVKKEYRKIFNKYDIEIIHEGSNVGIQDGRHLVAEHFDNSEHDYYIFNEEDMLYVSRDEYQNKNGFVRYVPDLFNKSITILERQELDYLKLTMIEYYGDCTQDWSYKNMPASQQDSYFPPREDGNSELRWKTPIKYLGFHRDLAYAVGDFHIDNWPILMNKKGNRQVYLENPPDHKYEHIIMVQSKVYIAENKIKGGCLLAAPIEHKRIEHYTKDSRKENRHY